MAELTQAQWQHIQTKQRIIASGLLTRGWIGREYYDKKLGRIVFEMKNSHHA